jgi:hypothetical protein
MHQNRPGALASVVPAPQLARQYPLPTSPTMPLARRASSRVHEARALQHGCPCRQGISLLHLLTCAAPHAFSFSIMSLTRRSHCSVINDLRDCCAAPQPDQPVEHKMLIAAVPRRWPRRRSGKTRDAAARRVNLHSPEKSARGFSEFGFLAG